MPEKIPNLKNLTTAGKEELALALLLWKDFKSDGSLNIEITKQTIYFAEMLDVKEQFDSLLTKLPPMKITALT